MAFESWTTRLVPGNGIIIYRSQDESTRQKVHRVLERYVKKHAFAIGKALPSDAVDSTAPLRANPPIDVRSEAPPPAKKMRTKNLPEASNASGALDADQLRVRYEYERVMLERTMQAHAVGRDSAGVARLVLFGPRREHSEGRGRRRGLREVLRGALDMLDEVSKMDNDAAVEHAGLRTSVYAVRSLIWTPRTSARRFLLS